MISIRTLYKYHYAKKKQKLVKINITIWFYKDTNT